MNAYLRKDYRKNITLIVVACMTVMCYMQCSPKLSPVVSSVPNTTPRSDSNKGLKDYFKNDFLVGVAVGSRSIRTDSALIIKEFNSVTAENDMKVGVIHPTEGTYNWKNADDIVAFAERNKIKIRGHNLLWHTQNAEWMFIGPDGKQASKELVLKRLKEHIFTVMNRYKGKIYSWDVVNEAIDDSQDPTVMYRKTKWLELFDGPDYIDSAFKFAHEADPNAKLYYNEFNSEREVKREKIFKLIKKLKDSGVPIDGVGFQAHWSLDYPTATQLRTALDQIVSLGLEIQITELDLTIHPRPLGAPAPTTQPVDPGYTPELEARQVAKYKEVFDILRAYKKNIKAVTFWNVTDRGSWLDSRGGGSAGDARPATPMLLKAYPLLFDVNGRRKKAYWAVVNK
jgi:endo-1,4-beta-xylanase